MSQQITEVIADDNLTISQPLRRLSTDVGNQPFSNLEFIASEPQLDALLAEVRAQLEAERAAGPPGREALVAELARARGSRGGTSAA